MLLPMILLFLLSFSVNAAIGDKAISWWELDEGAAHTIDALSNWSLGMVGTFPNASAKLGAGARGPAGNTIYLANSSIKLGWEEGINYSIAFWYKHTGANGGTEFLLSWGVADTILIL